MVANLCSSIDVAPQFLLRLTPFKWRATLVSDPSLNSPRGLEVWFSGGIVRRDYIPFFLGVEVSTSYYFKWTMSASDTWTSSIFPLQNDKTLSKVYCLLIPYFSLQKRRKQEKHTTTSALIKSLEYTTHPFSYHNHQQKRLSWGMQDL